MGVRSKGVVDEIYIGIILLIEIGVKLWIQTKESESDV